MYNPDNVTTGLRPFSSATDISYPMPFADFKDVIQIGTGSSPFEQIFI